jgi:pimeloyl-ACP methyl ester carboxylesterase
MNAINAQNWMTALLVAGAASLLAILASTTPAVALEPEREYVQIPEQAGIVYDDVTFETDDGVELHGWFLPFQDHDGNEHRMAAPMLIIVPPTEGNMGELLWHYFRFLRGAPWHVLVFDWRGYGTSADWELDPTHVIEPEFIRDLHAAIDHVKTLPEWDGKKLGIYAFNAGAAVAMATVATRDDVTCLAIRGIYTDQKALVENVRAHAPDRVSAVNEKWKAGLEPLAVAPKVRVPVWVIAGERDQLTTAEMGKEVYQALGGKRQFWLAKGAGHTGADMPENVQIDEFTSRLHAFLRRYLGTPG